MLRPLPLLLLSCALGSGVVAAPRAETASGGKSLQAAAADPTEPLAQLTLDVDIVNALLVQPIAQYNLPDGWAVEPFYAVAHEGPSPRWGACFGVSLLLPE